MKYPPGHFSEVAQAWPGMGFRSELCDPNSPHTMVSRSAFISQQSRGNREQAAREGRGWATGSIESLAGEHFKPGPVPMLNAKPFKFKPGSIAEKVYILLRDEGPKTTPEIRAALLLKKWELKPYLTPAIRAGVIVSRRVEANTNVYEVGQVVEVTDA